MIQETELKVVTISPKNGDVGMQFEAQVLLHLHDTDGSQIVVLKTPRRESNDTICTVERKAQTLF